MTVLDFFIKGAEMLQTVQPQGVLHLVQVLLLVDLFADFQDGWQEMARDRFLPDMRMDACVCVRVDGGGGRRTLPRGGLAQVFQFAKVLLSLRRRC